MSRRTTFREQQTAVPARGFTLVEATLSLVIVSIMLVASLALFGSFARASRARSDQTRAMLLAQQLMGEIVQYPYSDPNGSSNPNVLAPDAGETRSTFNDVGDFNGWSESPPVDRSGVALAGFTGWKRSVAVSFVDPTNPSAATSGDQGLKRIVVTVTTPLGKSITLTALRTASGLYEHSPSTPITFNSWATVVLQPGTNSGASVSSSVNTVNLVP